MNRVQTLMAILLITCMGAHAFSGDAVKQAPLNKHQMAALMIDCMKRRMWADQKISYNDAAQACKDQLRQHGARGTSDALMASDNPAK